MSLIGTAAIEGPGSFIWTFTVWVLLAVAGLSLIVGFRAFVKAMSRRRR